MSTSNFVSRSKHELRFINHELQVAMVCKEQISTVGDALLVRAPAKINLSLLIAGQRADGFHEVETVMAKVNWYDEILIQHGQKANIELICEGPHWAPRGKENLVYQACELLLDSYQSQTDMKITLKKNIPPGTGLGSASSDAAATLIGVSRFLRSTGKVNIGPEAYPPPEAGQPELALHEMAAKLGSDVAFFLDGPLAFCTGKGEKIKKIDEIFNFWALLVLPHISVSTKRVYANYKHDASLYEKLSTRINSYIQKNRIDLVSKMCANMLQTSCFRMHKELAELKTKIEALGLGPVCLSGSGAAIFCIVEGADEKKAVEYQNMLEEKIGCKSVIVSNNRW